MKLSEIRGLAKALKDIDTDQIKNAAVKVEQDLAYASYAHNIYIAGWMDGRHATLDYLRKVADKARSGHR